MMFSHLLRDSDAVLVAPNAIRVRLNELICLIRGAWPLSQEMPVGKYFVGDEVITKNIAGPGSGVLRCDWGCALTVQKAEGSEWGRVLVVDHGADDKVGQKSWNYVALTRARNTVTVVRLRKDSALLG